MHVDACKECRGLGMLAQLDLLSQPCTGVDQAVHDARHSKDTSNDGAGRCYKMIPAGTSARVRGSVGGYSHKL